MIANATVTQIGAEGSSDTWTGETFVNAPRWQGRWSAYFVETSTRRRSSEGADVTRVDRTLTIFGGIPVTPIVDDLITFQRHTGEVITGRVLSVAGPAGHQLIPQRMQSITVRLEDAA